MLPAEKDGGKAIPSQQCSDHVEAGEVYAAACIRIRFGLFDHDFVRVSQSYSVLRSRNRFNKDETSIRSEWWP